MQTHPFAPANRCEKCAKLGETYAEVGMYTEDADALYNEMCRVIGDAVLILAEANFETKRVVIADALRTALASNHERPDQMKTAMELAIKLLEQ